MDLDIGDLFWEMKNLPNSQIILSSFGERPSSYGQISKLTYDLVSKTFPYKQGHHK